MDAQTVAAIPVDILDIVLNVVGQTDIGAAGRRATVFYGLHYLELCPDTVLDTSARSRLFNLISFQCVSVINDCLELSALSDMASVRPPTDADKKRATTLFRDIEDVIEYLAAFRRP